MNNSQKLLFVLLFLLCQCFLHSQSDYSCELQKGNVPESISIPYVSNSASTRSAEIIVNFLNSDVGTPFPEALKGAFSHAAGILEERLYSNIPIYFDVKVGDAAGAIANILLNGNYKDFDSVDPFYEAGFWYGTALAEKLRNAEITNDASGLITIDEATSFYTGIDANCPTSQYDLVTVALHEMLHGLDFLSRSVSGSAEWLTPGLGLNHRIQAKFIGDGNGTFLEDFETFTNPPGFNEFIFEDVYWISNSTGGGAHVFTKPQNLWNHSCMTHLHPETHSGNGPAKLMLPVLSMGTALHNPGLFVQGVLEDVGWVEPIMVGTEDELSLHGYDLACFLYPPPGSPVSNWEDCQTSMQTELNVGEAVEFAFVFTDNEPQNEIPAVTWKLESFCTEGAIILAECQSNYCNSGNVDRIWELVVPDLPSDYQWSRNLQNQVNAKLTISGIDFVGNFYEESINLGINYRPDKPEIEFIPDTDNDFCLGLELGFYGSGAGYYQVSCQAEHWPDWLWLHWDIALGQFTSANLFELDPGVDYSFRVKGINDAGISDFSNILQREDCGIWDNNENRFVISPNPTQGEFMITAIDNLSTIKKVDIFSQSTPNITTQVIGGAYSNEVSVNIASMPSGLYEIIIFTNEGPIEIRQIYKE